jgi:hypothetical protein
VIVIVAVEADVQTGQHQREDEIQAHAKQRSGPAIPPPPGVSGRALGLLCPPVFQRCTTSADCIPRPRAESFPNTQGRGPWFHRPRFPPPSPQRFPRPLHQAFLDEDRAGVQPEELHTLLLPVEKHPDLGSGERLGNEFLLPLYVLQENQLAKHIPIRSGEGV